MASTSSMRLLLRTANSGAPSAMASKTVQAAPHARCMLSTSAPARLGADLALRAEAALDSKSAPAEEARTDTTYEKEQLPINPPPNYVFVPGHNPPMRPYARYRPELPKPPNYRLHMLGMVVFSVFTWSAFVLHSTNRERLSSSVVKNVMERVQESEEVVDAVGEDVRMKRQMLLGGDPWVTGAVNMMQGRVDISFKVKGEKGEGTVYFSAIRRHKGAPYETLRFLVVLDSSKESISLL